MATSVDAKLIRQTKFPPEFNQKVDMRKVNIEVMKKWIAGKISEILGSEDDVVIELCFNLLEGSRFPDIKVLQIQLTGFLDKDTAKFCKELWTLCLSAQSNPQGVPKELLEAKKLELIQEKIAAEKAAEEARKRQEQEKVRDRNIENVRQRERGDRVERGRGRGRGGRLGRDYDRRPRRNSRSPPPRRSRSPRRPSPARRREIDTYVPSSGGRRGRSLSISRSPSSRLSSRSATPPRARRRENGDRYQSSRYSRSRSRSRPRYRKKEGLSRGKRDLSPNQGDRRKPIRSPGNSRSRSRSRSPRRYRKKRSPSNSSASRSPGPRRMRTERYRPRSVSRSASRHRSLEPEYRASGQIRRGRGSFSYASDDDAADTRADARKGPSRSDRHGSSSRDRRMHSKRADTRRTSRRSISRSRSRSRSQSRGRHDRKRYRSIERYEPIAKRRRNTSSVSSEDIVRHGTANSSMGKEHRTNAPS